MNEKQVTSFGWKPAETFWGLFASSSLRKLSKESDDSDFEFWRACFTPTRQLIAISTTVSIWNKISDFVFVPKGVILKTDLENDWQYEQDEPGKVIRIAFFYFYQKLTGIISKQYFGKIFQNDTEALILKLDRGKSELCQQKQLWTMHDFCGQLPSENLFMAWDQLVQLRI